MKSGTNGVSPFGFAHNNFVMVRVESQFTVLAPLKVHRSKRKIPGPFLAPRDCIFCERALRGAEPVRFWCKVSMMTPVYPDISVKTCF